MEKVDKEYYYDNDKYDCSYPVNFVRLSLGLINITDLPVVSEGEQNE